MATNETARTDLSGNAVEEITSNLRRLLADVFALYVKTKNFHWHISGRHFRDYHLLLDEQADADLRDDGYDRRAGAQDRRNYHSFHQRHRKKPTAKRQQQRRREPAGNAQRAV